jgi:transcriptional regulator GlxA family with amidase domain
MIRIGIPAIQQATAISVAAPKDILSYAEYHLGGERPDSAAAPAFVVEFVGLDDTPVRCGDSVWLTPQQVVGSAASYTYDVILVPSFNDRIEDGLEANRAFIPWLCECHRRGTVMATWCSGAFMLAAAGLLDGKAATTHWAMTERFATQFPQVNLQTDRMIIDEGDVITCGGATSFLNLGLYLIERFHSRDMAVQCAKMFLIDMDRPTQRPYTTLTGQALHTDATIRQIQDYIQTNMREELSLQRLAHLAKLSPKTFMRRFKEATGVPPATHVQHVRIEAAKQLLEQSERTIGEITFEVGYNDIRSFRRLFQRYVGLSPKAYRAKFQEMTTYARSSNYRKGHALYDTGD